MSRAKLEIIITHYNEPWAVCSKMFKMLDVQRGMQQGECRVTIVQDGNDGALDTAQLMKRYPFITGVVEIAHRGISAARNAGLDSADAEFVMFCDCDDMLYSCDSLRAILDAIDDADGRADLIRGKFMIEGRTADGVWTATPQEGDWIFMHGKAWRLEWLREKRIRFDERIDYSEDSLFCAEAALEISPKRIGKLGKPIYMWCLRGGSCTSDETKQARNREHLAIHRCYMPEICMARGKTEEALTHALRGMYDSYHEYTGGTIPPKELVKLEGVIARGLVIPWAAKTERADPDEAAQLWKVSRESTIRKKQWTVETEPYREWVQRLTETYRE